ncbi:MAG: hypothetical protein J0I31_15880 [Rhizobiales bacterium]|nr:hypothetical protein [Hyphomicrobiales bacterium]
MTERSRSTSTTEEGEARAFVPGLFQLAAEFRLELQAVGDAGQAVEGGGVVHQLLGLALLDDELAQLALADDQDRDERAGRNDPRGEQFVEMPGFMRLAHEKDGMDEISLQNCKKHRNGRYDNTSVDNNPTTRECRNRLCIYSSRQHSCANCAPLPAYSGHL